jgi:hypothetical protein
MELIGGQSAAGEPAEQLVGVEGRISTVSGVKLQDARFGSPEQESVTNMGAVRDALFDGVMVTSAVPEAPCLSTIGNDVGVIGVRLIPKSGVPPLSPVTSLTGEVEIMWVVSPE